jgi:hypothetical protein
MRVDGTTEVRRFAGIVLPGVSVALGVVPWLVLGHDLPHRAAAHFNWRGHPNGSLPLPVLAVLLGGVTVACAALLVAWTWTSFADRSNRWVGFLAAFMSVFFGLLSLWIALANRGHADWHDVRLEPGAVGGSLGAAFGVAFAFAAVTAVQHADPLATHPSLPLAEDERAAWFGRASNVGLSVLGVVMVLVATGLVVAGLYGAASGIGIGGLVVIGASSLRVAVGERGVVVTSGPLHWPSLRFALDDVVSAGAIDFKPLHWGGWGYRGSLRLFRRAAWGLRSGPAIELELRNGRRFAVTVDHADDGAAVINGLLAHRPLY